MNAVRFHLYLVRKINLKKTFIDLFRTVDTYLKIIAGKYSVSCDESI